MPIKYKNIGPSAALIGRFGQRAVEGLTRHGDSSPLFAPFRSTLPLLVGAYLLLLSDVRGRQRETQRKNRLSRETTEVLSKDMRGWFAAVSRDLPEFDRSDYPWTQVADDAFHQSGRFVDFVSLYQREAAEPLPYAQDLIERQTALAEPAEAARQEAQGAMADLTARRRELHQSGIALNAELVAFRQVLRTVLGREHRDYQRLRFRRNGVVDDGVGDADLAQLEADLTAEALAAEQEAAADANDQPANGVETA